MNVASPDLCKELYELSGWFDTFAKYYLLDGMRSIRPSISIEDEWPGHQLVMEAPAYNLGYLLRKLDGHVTLTNEWAAGGWRAIFKKTGDMYEGPQSVEIGDTPEDAVARLTIKLFKQKILTKGKTDNE